MKKGVLVVVLISLVSFSFVKAGDLDIGAQFFAAVGHALFSTVAAVVEDQVGQTLTSYFVKSPVFSGLNPQALQATGRHDLKILLGTVDAPLCYAACAGGNSSFEQFKRETKLYQALLTELGNEGQVMSFYTDLNNRMSLSEMTGKYVSRLSKFALSSDWEKIFQKIGDHTRPITSGTLIAINQILEGEAKLSTQV